MTEAKNKISGLKTIGVFAAGRACSDTLFHVLSDAYRHPMELEEKAAMLFAGGILQHGYQCGMIWGSTLAAGAEAEHRFGFGAKAQSASIIAAGRIVDSFRDQSKYINCMEITDLDKNSTNWDQLWYFLFKGGTFGCFKRAAKYAPVAFESVEAAFADDDPETPELPVSCAALSAEKLGASEQHISMVSGLAGGIGLCGGCCGALGTALWILAMRIKDPIKKESVWKSKEFNKKAEELIDSFLQVSDFEFECEKIVGHKFESVSDHASFVKDGGCLKLIETLVANISDE